MDREGQVHSGVNIAYQEDRLRIDLEGLTGGKTVLVYGQTEVTHDLYAARDALGGVVIDEAADVTPHGPQGRRPYLTFVKEGAAQRLDSDSVIACAGSHCITHPPPPPPRPTTHDRAYPLLRRCPR